MKKRKKRGMINFQKEIGRINILGIVAIFMVSLAHLGNIQAYSNVGLKSNISEYKSLNLANLQEKTYIINIDGKDYLLKIQPLSQDN